MKTNEYTLYKNIWTVKDFDQMDWHDNAIHSLSFRRKDEHAKGDILFDIDYILKWVTPIDKGQIFFWVAPCTLLFHDTFDLEINIKTNEFFLSVKEVNGIELTEKTPDLVGGFVYSWTIDLLIGHIKFKSSGFTQTLRAKPIYTNSKCLTMDERAIVN